MIIQELIILTGYKCNFCPDKPNMFHLKLQKRVPCTNLMKIDLSLWIMACHSDPVKNRLPETSGQTDGRTDGQTDRRIIQFLNPNPYLTIRQHYIDILTGTKHEINVIYR